MRIALTSDPEIPVPPRYYGGIERIVDMLARELVARGHEVTLFAHPESRSAGTLVAWPGRSSGSTIDTARNALTLAKAVADARFDVVHSFSRVAYLAPILHSRTPKLMTYQREINPRSIRLGHAMSGGSLAFSAISRWMMRDVEKTGRWFMIPNGVSLDAYDFKPLVAPDAPFLFLGRIEKVKGPHLAIEIARRAGRRLILAGNVPPEHQAWFDTRIGPHVDGEHVAFVGPVNDEQKNELLGKTAALLMPILWEEPFGIVMAEAMACGVPVLGLRRGAVAEVVEDGLTGFVGESVEDLAAAAGRLEDIDRAECRRRVERLYSAGPVVDGYVEAYRQLIESR